MLSAYIQSRASNPALVRVLTILGFAALTALGAKISIDLQPVPITLQVLVVLLAGLSLGAKDGAASQIAYVSAITAGLPLDQGGFGTLVWTRPTAGYLIGFIVGAFVTGYLAERGMRRGRALRFIAALAGVAVIYLVGTAWLTLGFLHGDWAKGWQLGVAPFIGVDLAKAVIATGATESVRAWLARVMGGQQI